MKEKTFSINTVERKKILRRISLLLADRKEIVFAYAHGSFIGGQPFHDIDIGILVSERFAQNELDCSLDMANLLSAGLGYPVDVRTLNRAPVSFRYHVIRGELILEKNEETLCQFVEDTIRRYLDLKPLLLHACREAFAA